MLCWQVSSSLICFWSSEMRHVDIKISMLCSFTLTRIAKGKVMKRTHTQRKECMKEQRRRGDERESNKPNLWSSKSEIRTLKMLNRCGKKTKRTVNDEDKQDNGEQKKLSCVSSIYMAACLFWTDLVILFGSFHFTWVTGMKQKSSHYKSITLWVSVQQ